ncbi:MAG: hypothetical protein ACHQUC_09690 [Chlamydiales bacterium]
MANQKKKRSLPFRLFCGFILLLSALFVYDTYINDLRTSNMVEELPYKPEWDVPSLAENEKMALDKILSQPFTYVGEGGQSYVFASHDQHYVLKLFKYKRFRPAWYIYLVPDLPLFASIRDHHVTSRARKLTTVFTGHKIAYTYNKQNSGLLFVQLNPSHLPTLISLKDKIGITRSFDLGEAAYVLQEKGEMLRIVFPRLLKNGDIDGVKKCIGQIFAMYLSEYSQGIYDDDHGVMQNFGFIGDKPFHLDVGKFKQDESYKQPDVYQQDLAKVAQRIRLWMAKYYPRYNEEIVQDMEEKLSHIFGKEFHFSQN